MTREVDRDAVRAFADQFALMSSHSVVMGAIDVADRTGLLVAMKDGVPATADELAARAEVSPRYAEEMLAVLAAAGIAEYDSSGRSFVLPDGARHCLTDETSPFYMAGWPQGLNAMVARIPDVAAAARRGTGVPFSLYGDDLVEGLDRMNSPAIRALLGRKWIRVMTDVTERLEGGGRVADLGCGSGAAALSVAAAFPATEVVGYDIDETSIARARRHADESGIRNLSFEVRSVHDLEATGSFDLAITFDVIHDLGDPEGAMRAIRDALVPGGAYLMVEPRAGATLEENLNQTGATLYSLSLLHCLPVSLSQGDAALGTAWGPVRAEEMATAAGFSSFERLPIDNPMNAFYRLSP